MTVYASVLFVNIFDCGFIPLRLVFSFLLLPSGHLNPVSIHNIFLKFTLIWNEHELKFKYIYKGQNSSSVPA